MLVVELVGEGGLECVGKGVGVVQFNEPVSDIGLGDHVTGVHDDSLDGRSGDLGCGFERFEGSADASEESSKTLRQSDIDPPLH